MESKRKLPVYGGAEIKQARSLLVQRGWRGACKGALDGLGWYSELFVRDYVPGTNATRTFYENHEGGRRTTVVRCYITSFRALHGGKSTCMLRLAFSSCSTSSKLSNGETSATGTTPLERSGSFCGSLFVLLSVRGSAKNSLSSLIEYFPHLSGGRLFSLSRLSLREPERQFPCHQGERDHPEDSRYGQSSETNHDGENHPVKRPCGDGPPTIPLIVTMFVFE